MTIFNFHNASVETETRVGVHSSTTVMDTAALISDLPPLPHPSITSSEGRPGQSAPETSGSTAAFPKGTISFVSVSYVAFCVLTDRKLQLLRLDTF